MDPRTISGLIWILFAVFMTVEGIGEYLATRNQGALAYVGIAALIFLWQIWLYRRTGKIGGPL